MADVREEFRQWLDREMRRNRYGARTLAEEFPHRTEVSHATVARWRRGEIEPSPHHVRALAKIFNVKPRMLFEMLGWLEPEDGDGLSARERQIIAAIAQLSDGQVTLVNQLIDGLVSQSSTVVARPDPELTTPGRGDTDSSDA